MRHLTLTFAAAVMMAGSALTLGAQPLRPNAFLAGAETPAQRKIEMAKAAITANPKHPQAHVDLAMALTQRARETADPVFYQQAEASVRAALALAPDDFEALKVRAWAQLGQHQFAAAHDLATALNARVPDDLMVYGMLTDANIELGRYDEAETSAQWMLDLRPGNIPALTRAAYLRELFGDIEGAIDLMRSAVNRMPFQESEDRAWVMTQIAHLELMRKQPAAAEQAAEQALALFPDYHYALGTLADVRTAQQRHRDAAILQRQRYEVAPHPENLYELAEAQARAGMTAEAAKSYTQFEQGARAEMQGDDNANRELIAYWAGAGKKPAEALKLAEKEIARRGDVYTREAYAWALYKNGRRADATREIEKALAVGVQHPRMLERAAAIKGTAATTTSKSSPDR